MTAWASFSDIQADAVRATAAKHLRDADELAEELAPLFIRAPLPTVTTTTQEPRTVTFEANVADPSWSLLGTTESGFSTYYFPSLALAHSTVNDYLTLAPEQEPA